MMRGLLTGRHLQKQHRRGVTIIIVAMLMVALVGITAITVDFSRMYVYQAQLQNAADAGAHSGAVSLAHGHNANAQTDAVTIGNANIVDGVATSVVAARVFPGTWDFTTRHFASSTWAAATADDVVATHTALYTLGRVFSRTNQALRAMAISAVGYHTGSDCLKPFAVNYRDLLNILPGGAGLPLSHDLTTAEVTYLQQNGPSSQIKLLSGKNATTAAGDIAEVVTWPNGGGNNYGSTIKSAGCAGLKISMGDTVMANTGVGQGQTGGPLYDYCNTVAGVKVTGSKNGTFSCSPAPLVKLVIYGSTVTLNGNGNGSTLGYVAKYVGEFGINGFQTTKPPNATESVVGYFSALRTDGTGFTSKPSPLIGGVALVQ